jgi:predicted amidohydrolase
MSDTRRPFKIAAAQIPSIRGDVPANVSRHEAALRAAAAAGVSVVVFPELSLIGYEPEIAASLAFTDDDIRLEPLRRIVLEHNLTTMIGAPIRTDDKPAIGTVILGPDGGRQIYRKMHLGGSEVSFFSPGTLPVVLEVESHRIGVSICADSSQCSHAESYYRLGARIYAAGVFLTDEWYLTDAPRLQKFAADFGMLTVMANQAASIGTHRSVGRSAVWNPSGSLLAEAEGTEEALVVATDVNGVWNAHTLGIQALT